MAINYDNINELIWSKIKMDIANRLDAVLCSIPINHYSYSYIKKAYHLVNSDLFDGMERDLTPLVNTIDCGNSKSLETKLRISLDNISIDLFKYKCIRDRDYQDFIDECEDREQVSLTTRFNFAK